MPVKITHKFVQNVLDYYTKEEQIKFTDQLTMDEYEIFIFFANEKRTPKVKMSALMHTLVMKGCVNYNESKKIIDNDADKLGALRIMCNWIIRHFYQYENYKLNLTAI